jgi:hypothetical protein
MSLASDLASAFAEVPATVPVLFGATVARGFFDRAGTIRKVGGVGVQLEKDTLYLPSDAIPGLVTDAEILVGPLGGGTAVGGTVYLIGRSPQPIEDGLIVAIELTGGPS